MATQDLAAIMREVYDAWNAKDLERCLSHCHPDARMTNMAFGAKLSFREYIENWARAFPDGKIELTKCVVQGDDCVCEFTGRGTHTGTLKGPTGEIPATNRRVQLACVECLHFRNGKIAEGRTYLDAFSLFTQLGLGASMQGRTTSAQPPASH